MEKKLINLPVPSELRESLQLTSGEINNIAVGKRVVRARIVEGSPNQNPTDNQTVYITDDLAAVLGLPARTGLNITKTNKALRLGPLVGVLAGRYSKERGSFGAQNTFFRSLLTSLRNLNGAGFVFCPQDINGDRKSIHGYYISGKSDERWKRMYFPLPDVCYNRYFNDTGSVGSYHTIALLARHGVKTFNNSIGSKWAVHRLLIQQSDIAPHLPETRLLESSQVLTSMLKRYKEVYLKPPSGCKGNGIIRVTRKKGAYLVKTADRDKGFLCRSSQEILKKTRASMDCSMPLVQQSIRFTKNSRHIDFRVLVQKNRLNKWRVTGIAARVGASGRITTNLHTGGKAQEPAAILQDRGFDPRQISSICTQLEEMALRVAEIIASKARALGELGLDFLIDTNGKVWFLEANPKPGRRAFSDISQDIRKVAVSRPMEYACHLAGF
ncbi:hypothetical protein ASZ90_017631 [hydrocarbon metagenome]|uniref:ATP-grasp domain-containing protein n=1 Tax=hydrocarbon metagenome TaxID=938273 RepID=A0A0W8E8J0_9ZZZZ